MASNNNFIPVKHVVKKNGLYSQFSNWDSNIEKKIKSYKL